MKTQNCNFTKTENCKENTQLQLHSRKRRIAKKTHNCIHGNTELQKNTQLHSRKPELQTQNCNTIAIAFTKTQNCKENTQLYSRKHRIA
jgi:hypothetical protein